MRLGVNGTNHQEGNVATQDRGFASMDPDKQRSIASKGGKAAHAKGRAHEWTADEAREAGRKGGAAGRRHDIERPASGPSAPDDETSAATMPPEV